MNKKFIYNFFKLKENNTNVRIEIMAGITTFFTMCYILIVNGRMFAELEGVSFGAVYIGTAVTTVIGTLLLAFLTNMPIAQSTSLGVNGFFVFICCKTLGFSYANSLLLVLIDGVIFIILTATGLRTVIYKSLPKCITFALPVGIGLFIAFIGLQSSKIVVSNPSTCVTMASMNLLAGANWETLMPFLITVLTLVAIVVMLKKGIKIGIFGAIIFGTILYYLLGLTLPDFFTKHNFKDNFDLLKGFSDFINISFLKVFKEGLDFSQYLAKGHNQTSLIINFMVNIIAFCTLNMFDCLGTVYACLKTGNMLHKNEKGEYNVPQMNKAMFCDAIATTVGAVFGTSVQTLYLESSSGIGVGGRTGFTGVVVAILFFIALFFVHIAALIPPCVYSAPLIYVGLLMLTNVLVINWKDLEESLPAFATIVIMPFTYNISYGIGFGLIFYIFIKMFMGKIKEVKLATWIVTILFLIMFLFTH